MENDKNQTNSVKKSVVLFICGIIVVIAGLACTYWLKLQENKALEKNNEIQKETFLSPYRLSGNSLEDFDLYFLQLEHNGKNILYSPLSIKYALEMLAEGANGDSKTQIDNIIGEYSAKKYTNSANMSFANALFVNNTYKNSINESYTSNLSSKYNAEVIYDAFTTPDILNSWVSNKTYHLVDNLMDNISDLDYIIVNALAIDMQWVNQLQKQEEDYQVKFSHEKFDKTIMSLSGGYHGLDFENNSSQVKSAEIGAVVNRYDIVNALGETAIRETVGTEYDKWLANGACGNPNNEPDTQTYLNEYIQAINANYKHVSSSTDFKFYVDDDIKAFAKELQEYDGTTLEYIGIMPKKVSLSDYIKSTKAKDISSVISKLKSIELDNFKDGVITEVSGYIPMFKFNYELNLTDDLKQLGIKDIFDPNKADLSKLSSSKSVISKTAHKANIEFSNDGIKAAAATALGGKGAAGCGFDYQYEVPVEHIDITFDKPYMFIIRDKNSGEVWFAGDVYEPIEYIPGLEEE